jgi:hypothetical protein
MSFEPDPNFGREIVNRTMARIGERMSLSEMCSPAFMTEHTTYASIDEMVDASPLAGLPQEELVAALSSGADDEFVIASSRNAGFRSWRDMYLEAARQEVKRRLSASE